MLKGHNGWLTGEPSGGAAEAEGVGGEVVAAEDCDVVAPVDGTVEGAAEGFELLQPARSRARVPVSARVFRILADRDADLVMAKTPNGDAPS